MTTPPVTPHQFPQMTAPQRPQQQQQQEQLQQHLLQQQQQFLQQQQQQPTIQPTNTPLPTSPVLQQLPTPAPQTATRELHSTPYHPRTLRFDQEQLRSNNIMPTFLPSGNNLFEQSSGIDLPPHEISGGLRRTSRTMVPRKQFSAKLKGKYHE